MMLETERLLLRPWRIRCRISTAMPATRMSVLSRWPVHTSIENSQEIIRDVFSVEETYAVCLKEDRRAIGSIGLIPPEQTQVAASPTEMEMGFWIGVPFWGRGYITEAVREIQRHAFEDLGCTALWCGYYDSNEKSKRVRRSAGSPSIIPRKASDCPLVGEVRTEHFMYLSRKKWNLI